MENSISNVIMFCIYHKKYYLRNDNSNFIFFGVNDLYPKKNTGKNILEYELDIYNPFLQKRGYMETSAYLHIYWNNLYHDKEMVGISQYDMYHLSSYKKLDKSRIYIINLGISIVKDGKWDKLMFPNIRNLKFLLDSYNNHFRKNYSLKELNNKPLSLYQTNIYPKYIFEKLCSWLEKLVDEIYPWCNEIPFETHWGSIGGYTERAISIFNALEIYEGIAYSNLEIKHGLSKCKKEQYDTNSFLNKYDKDIYCKILEDDDGNLEDYIKVKNKIVKNKIIRVDDEITKFYYVDNNFEKSRELMIIGNNENKEFQWYENILNSNLIDYEIYYRKYDENKFIILIKKKI